MHTCLARMFLQLRKMQAEALTGWINTLGSDFTYERCRSVHEAMSVIHDCLDSAIHQLGKGNYAAALMVLDSASRVEAEWGKSDVASVMAFVQSVTPRGDIEDVGMVTDWRPPQEPLFLRRKYRYLRVLVPEGTAWPVLASVLDTEREGSDRFLWQVHGDASAQGRAATEEEAQFEVDRHIFKERAFHQLYGGG